MNVNRMNGSEVVNKVNQNYFQLSLIDEDGEEHILYPRGTGEYIS